MVRIEGKLYIIIGGPRLQFQDYRGDRGKNLRKTCRNNSELNRKLLTIFRMFNHKEELKIM